LGFELEILTVDFQVEVLLFHPGEGDFEVDALVMTVGTPSGLGVADGGFFSFGDGGVAFVALAASRVVIHNLAWLVDFNAVGFGTGFGFRQGDREHAEFEFGADA